MLKIIQYKNKSDVEKYFQQLDAVNESWIIANLKTKQELQKRIIETQGYYLNTSILRIRDFWLQVFNANYPEYKIISKETYHILVKNILEKYKDQIQIQVVDPEKKCQDLNYFINLLLDPSFDLNSDRFSEWLDLFERRKFQLKSNLLVNKLIANFLLKHKSIPYDWVSSFIQTSGMNFSSLKQRKFYFDLASEISMKEAEFIYELSKEKEIVVFQSEYEANSKYQFLLKPYEFLNAKLEKSQIVKPQDSALQPQILLRKFSNSLAECRDVVGQVQKWIDAGVQTSDIQILAPQIEVYWPLLQSLFKIQNIQVQKNKVFKLVTLPQVQLILSKIKFFQRSASAADLEKILFLNQSKSYCSFNDFKESFSSPFFSFEELWVKIKEKIPALIANDLKLDVYEVNLQEELLRKDFFTKFAMLFEEHLEGEVFDHIISELFNGSHEEMRLQISDWFEWVMLSLEKLELKLENNREGVRIDSLMSSQSFNSKYVYALGVDDTYFANSHDVDIDPEDILSLASELGYYLDHPDYNFRTYELETLKEKTQNVLILSYALKDLKGDISNPCSVWQKLAFEQKLMEKHTDLHQETNWDGYQRGNPETFFLSRNSNYNFENYKKDLNTDYYKSLMSDQESTSSLSDKASIYSLSPSSVKSFSECQFKFYMQKEILAEESDVEQIDISNKEKGQWYHRVYQLIIENWEAIMTEWTLLDSEEKQMAFLQERFSKEVPKTISSPFWHKIRSRYFAGIVSFIQHEQSLRKLFPHIQDLGCEVKWKAYFDEVNKKWVKEKPEKGFLFRGTIDRVLLNKATGKVWLVDYKLGAQQAPSFSAWSKDSNWQLMYYTLALEQGFVEDIGIYPVELAQYWVVNKWEIKKGYSDGLEHDFVLKTKKDLLAENQKEQLVQKFNEFVFEQVQKIRERKFPPLPKDEKLCRKCQWSLMCRAPHLN